MVYLTLSSHIKKDLETAGWDTGYTADKTFTLVESVVHKLPFLAHYVFIELVSLKRSQFPTLRAFPNRLEMLWARATKEDQFSDKVWVSIALEGIKTSNPEWYSYWWLDLHKNGPIEKDRFRRFLESSAYKEEELPRTAAHNLSPSTSPMQKMQPSKRNPRSGHHINETSSEVHLECGCLIKPNRPTHKKENCWVLHPEKRPWPPRRKGLLERLAAASP